MTTQQSEPVRALRTAALAARAVELAALAEQTERDADERFRRAVGGVREAALRILKVEVHEVQLKPVPQLLTSGEPIFEFTRDGLDFRGRREGGEYIVELRASRANDSTAWLRVRDLASLGAMIWPEALR